MTFEEAVKLLEKKYERAKNIDYVQRPLAWALYQVWKEVEYGKQREYNRIAQQKSRAKRKAVRNDG